MRTYLIFLLLIILTGESLLSQNIIFKDNSCCYGSIIDTIKVGKYSIELRSLWKNDTIVIRKYIEPSVVDTNFFRLLNENKSHIPNSKEIKDFNAFYAMVAQNCHSYSLEKIFSNNNINTTCFFNNETYILSEYFQIILNLSFNRIQEFKVIRKKKIIPKEQFVNNCILVFYNQYNMISHSVYYKDGLFYTKNGGLKPKIEEKISEILKLYWDTKKIETFILKN